MSDPAPFVSVEYVCKGRRIDRDELTLYVVLAPLTGDGADQDRIYTIQPGKNGASLRWLKCGQRYDIPTSGTTIKSGDAKYLGPFEGAELVSRWQLETAAAEAELELLKLHKRADDRDELLAALLPFRRTYQKTIGTARKTALELALLAALRTPPRERE